MNNGANPKSQINGFSTNLIKISIIGIRLTKDCNSLIEGVNRGRSIVELQPPLWGMAPSLSPPHMWALLGALWLMIHSAGLCFSSISPSIDIQTQQKLSSASDQELMDSSSTTVVYLLGICTPLGWISYFLYK